VYEGKAFRQDYERCARLRLNSTRRKRQIGRSKLGESKKHGHVRSYALGFRAVPYTCDHEFLMDANPSAESAEIVRFKRLEADSDRVKKIAGTNGAQSSPLDWARAPTPARRPAESY
jgi:hypothetical protein